MGILRYPNYDRSTSCPSASQINLLKNKCWFSILQMISFSVVITFCIYTLNFKPFWAPIKNHICKLRDYHWVQHFSLVDLGQPFPTLFRRIKRIRDRITKGDTRDIFLPDVTFRPKIHEFCQIWPSVWPWPFTLWPWKCTYS